jgi:hypothetical protein
MQMNFKDDLQEIVERTLFSPREKSLLLTMAAHQHKI